MKLGVLRSIGHNMTDSLADGASLLTGVYDLDVFGEAKRSAQGYIEVDFLTGDASGGTPSPALAHAFALSARALPALCAKHGVPANAFRVARARFSMKGHVRSFEVTVEGQDGRRATDLYTGMPGKRVKSLDPLGRVRKTPTAITRAARP